MKYIRHEILAIYGIMLKANTAPNSKITVMFKHPWVITQDTIVNNGIKSQKFLWQ